MLRVAPLTMVPLRPPSALELGSGTGLGGLGGPGGYAGGGGALAAQGFGGHGTAGIGPGAGETEFIWRRADGGPRRWGSRKLYFSIVFV